MSELEDFFIFEEKKQDHDAGGRSKPKWKPDSIVTASFSECKKYRYTLLETWDDNLPKVMFLMMNPSVANIEHADPTLIKTGTYARTWGYGAQYIGNIHAYRATDSKRLMETVDPVGPENDNAILTMAKSSEIVVLAYGKPPKPLRKRGETVVKMLQNAGIILSYLRLSKDGIPCHPLYLPSNLTPTHMIVSEQK